MRHDEIAADLARKLEKATDALRRIYIGTCGVPRASERIAQIGAVAAEALSALDAAREEA